MTQIRPLAFPLMPPVGPCLAGADGSPDTSGFLDLMPVDSDEPASDPEAVPEDAVLPVPAIPAPVAFWQPEMIADVPAGSAVDGTKLAPAGLSVTERATLPTAAKTARDVGPAQPIASPTAIESPAAAWPGFAPQINIMPDMAAPEMAAPDMAVPQAAGSVADQAMRPAPPMVEAAADELPLPQKDGQPPAQAPRSPMDGTTASDGPNLAPLRQDDSTPPPVTKPAGPLMTMDAGQDRPSANNDIARAVPLPEPAATEAAPPPLSRAGPAAAAIALTDPLLSSWPARTSAAVAPMEVQHRVTYGEGSGRETAPASGPPSQWQATPTTPQAIPERQDSLLPDPLQAAPAGQVILPDTPTSPGPEEDGVPAPADANRTVAMPQEERAGRALWTVEAEPMRPSERPVEPAPVAIRPSISAISETVPVDPKAEPPVPSPSETEAPQTVREPADRGANLAKADPAPVAAPLVSPAPPAGQSPVPGQHAAVAADRPTAPLPDGPVPVRLQILQALSASGSPVTELRLAPDELGAVRIDMRHEGDRLVMTVSAERPETLDLLRRHAGDLVADLRAGGQAGLDLSFGRWSGPGPDTGRPPAEMSDAPAALPTEALPAAAAEIRPPSPAQGLYLRI